MLFYAHPEEPRAWDRPELTGMEIYNIHTDFKNERNRLGLLLPDLLVNQRRYPDQVFRLIFNRPTAFLRHCDDLNRTRHITGIAGNDCHQMIADSAGFLWFAQGTAGRAVMGETLAFSRETWLRAASPHVCRFTILKNGDTVCQQVGRTLEWAPPGPGKYRVEAELKVLEQWVPWVYANPIELR